MSWISKLCETYDNCSVDVLTAESDKDLLPIGHTTQYSQIEIVLNQNGDFQTARVLDKETEGQTVIPCTEDSASRSGTKPKPHPLFDKLQAIAGDFVQYLPSQYSSFEDYLSQLELWVSSPYAHEMVTAIYQYVKKGTVIQDLVNANILYLDESGNVLDKWKGDGEKPPIFSQTTDPSDSFVRFRVEVPGVADSRVWMNGDVRQKFIDFYLSQQNEQELCYVSGELEAPSRKSGGKIRNVGDRAKLISSNDKDGFTFRGRFTTPDEAVTLSYSAAQKYVNALKWLIKKQGWRNGDQTIVSWGTKNEELPSLDTSLLLFDEETTTLADTRSEFASRLNKAIAGYAAKLTDSSNIVVMGLDSTNGLQGRLSITYYRELTGSDFLRRIEHWHKTASWYPLNIPVYNPETNKYPLRAYYAAPAISSVVVNTYGKRVDDKLRKAAIERLLPCIIDRKPIPRDIVSELAFRASRPFAIDDYEYKQTLSVACAIIRKYYNDLENEHTGLDSYTEVWTVELNELERDRSYLFGRLLAYARRIEEYALYVGKTDARQTNAERLMLQFKKRPMKTWDVLYGKLLPYLSRFRASSTNSIGNRYEAEMNAVMEHLKDVPDGFSDEQLSPLYLLGYQSQLSAFEKQIQERMKNKNVKEDGE